MKQYALILFNRIEKVNGEKEKIIENTKGYEIIGKFGFENESVKSIKSATINLINFYNNIGKDPRRVAKAITDIESAQMFIVKSLFH